MWKAESAGMRVNVFTRRKRLYTFTLLGMVVFYVLAAAVVEFNALEGFTALPRAVSWIVSNLVPTEKAFARLPKILGKLLETTLLSISVTVTAAVCAFFFSLLGSKTTRVSGALSSAVRMVAAFFRNVPDVVWAMLLLFSFGQNILTGFFALFFTTFGMLTRTFIETIDEVSASCTEALYATGATTMQTVFQAIIPSTMAENVTWVLFMIETNIRSSTLIGMLTATGIGYLFDLYYKRLDYGSASLVVLSIVAAVLLIETISSRIRKVIL
jgi:phosphonate transport system permease protein